MPSTVAETVYVSTVQTHGFTNDNDYVGKADEQLAFAGGEASKTVTVALVNDGATGEPAETFGLIVQRTPGPVTDYLSAATFTILDAPAAPVPATPTNPAPGTATSPGPTIDDPNVTLSWTASSGATYYSIGVRDMTSNTLVVDTTTPNTSYIAALSGGGQFRWNVAACNDAGCSAFTTALYFKTGGTPPGPVPATPTDPAPGTTTGPGSDDRRPERDAELECLEQVRRTTASVCGHGERHTGRDTTTPDTSYLVNLSAGGQYRWNVAACNDAGCSPFTTSLYFQTGGTPPPPGEPVLSVVPAGPINFGGPVEIKTEVTETLIVTNTGGGRLTGTCVASEPYTVAECAFDLPEKQSASFTLRFRPTDPVPYPSDVLFFSNAKSEVTIVLEGVGKNAEPPPDRKPYVVFLPGIGGSRLWGSDAATGQESRLWPASAIKTGLCRLRPSNDGAVGQIVYTKPVNLDREDESGVLGEYKNDPVYIEFLDFLNGLAASEGVISGWEAVPYDWRKNVLDVADTDSRNAERGISICNEPDSNCRPYASIVDRLKELKAIGKAPVTLVGHSNGGLLAKAIVNELRADAAIGPDERESVCEARDSCSKPTAWNAEGVGSPATR